MTRRFDFEGGMDPETLIKNGAIKHSDGNIDDAIALFDKAIIIDPDNAMAYFFRGKAKVQKEDYIGAEKDFYEALKRESHYYTKKNLIEMRNIHTFIKFLIYQKGLKQ